MSLVSNVDDVAFYSGYPVDKIARIFTGSYSAGDLITRVGNLSTAYVYRIAHGLTRPVECELLTSTDGGTTWDLGIRKIAFSDSTYVYIFHGYATTGTPVTYKVYCSWIDDYDTTNPSVEAITYPSQPVLFKSTENYQKIYTRGVSNFDAGTFGAPQTRTITHPLGYAPNAKVFFEAYSGEVWPLNTGGVRNAYLYDGAQDEAETGIYSDRIEITLNRFSGAARRAWYRIYYDAN